MTQSQEKHEGNCSPNVKRYFSFFVDGYIPIESHENLSSLLLVAHIPVYGFYRTDKPTLGVHVFDEGHAFTMENCRLYLNRPQKKLGKYNRKIDSTTT